ncbi:MULTISPECIES: hypothetical protein [unclassified Rhizobium]|uniref:hypothetical protein n=1 Tax=unclassified Rhizobium TaxID=2613769 RepID=UPI001C83A4FB|nr:MULTISPECIES: hypothetical protein [unclassified Rhizobium]MBX5212978.1 hypothetical protein [Rhizobium sp. NLR9a]MBX5219965.1 hypothetical protein [Rhizobium sp. NLR8a]MBX5225625.1 hypothetical protein [Rhizobium sp. NLR9b]MBX5239293.1 hypothetical protein [Rhizobium sp. NLR22b]MBX5243247.1 hypothetical protein [Rhizobium sp. NLR3b]
MINEEEGERHGLKADSPTIGNALIAHQKKESVAMKAAFAPNEPASPHQGPIIIPTAA